MTKKVIEISKFHFDYEIHPHVCSETAEHASTCLGSHQVSQERCTTKLQVLQKAAWAVKGNSCAQELPSLAQDLAAWHGGKRLNEKPEISPSSSPGVTTVVRWQRKEGWCHQTIISDTQQPSYTLGLCFDNILYFP